MAVFRDLHQLRVIGINCYDTAGLSNNDRLKCVLQASDRKICISYASEFMFRSSEYFNFATFPIYTNKSFKCRSEADCIWRYIVSKSPRTHGANRQ